LVFRPRHTAARQVNTILLQSVCFEKYAGDYSITAFDDEAALGLAYVMTG